MGAVKEGDTSEHECHDLGTAAALCEAASDCYAVATQDSVCGDLYRVTHSGADFVSHDTSPLHAYYVEAYVLDRSCLAKLGQAKKAATGAPAPPPPAFAAAGGGEVAGVPPCDHGNEWLSTTLSRHPQCLGLRATLAPNRSSVDSGKFAGASPDAVCDCLAQLSYGEVYHDGMLCTLPPNNAVAIPARWLQCQSRSFCFDYAATCPGEEQYPGECDLAAWLAGTVTSPGEWYSNGAAHAEDTLTCRLVQLLRARFSTQDRATSCHAASPSGGDICLGPLAAPDAREGAAGTTPSFASPSNGKKGTSAKGSSAFNWTKFARGTGGKQQKKAGKGKGTGKGKESKGKGKGNPPPKGQSLEQLIRYSADNSPAVASPHVVLAAFVSAAAIVVAVAAVRRRRSLSTRASPPDSPARAALRPDFGMRTQKQQAQLAEHHSCLQHEIGGRLLLEESDDPHLLLEEITRPADGHRGMALYLLNNDNGRLRPPTLGFTA